MDISRFENKIENIGSRLEKAIQLLAVLALAISCILVFISVIFRYIFGISEAWIEESARYLVILFVFLLAAPMIKRNEHIAFHFLSQKLKKQASLFQLIVIIAGLTVTVLMVTYTYRLIVQVKGWAQITEAGILYTWWLYSFLFAGMILSAFFYLEKLINWLTTLNKTRT